MLCYIMLLGLYGGSESCAIILVFVQGGAISRANC